MGPNDPFALIVLFFALTVINCVAILAIMLFVRGARHGDQIDISRVPSRAEEPGAHGDDAEWVSLVLRLRTDH